MGWSINRSTGLTYHRSGLSTKGYTLLTPHGDQSSYLIDMDGRIVHRWTFKHIHPGYGRLLNNGNLSAVILTEAVFPLLRNSLKARCTIKQTVQT